jgi:hypothetical protein
VITFTHADQVPRVDQLVAEIAAAAAASLQAQAHRLTQTVSRFRLAP